MKRSISDAQYNNAVPCAECHNAECCVLCTVMLSDIILNVSVLSVVTVVKGFIVHAPELA
jgi:hypothetical protein